MGSLLYVLFLFDFSHTQVHTMEQYRSFCSISIRGRRFWGVGEVFLQRPFPRSFVAMAEREQRRSRNPSSGLTSYNDDVTGPVVSSSLPSGSFLFIIFCFILLQVSSLSFFSVSVVPLSIVFLF